jgi:hypothetical protein
VESESTIADTSNLLRETTPEYYARQLDRSKVVRHASNTRPQLGAPRDLLTISYGLKLSSRASSSASLFFPCRRARPHRRLRKILRHQTKAEDLRPSTTPICASCEQYKPFSCRYLYLERITSTNEARPQLVQLLFVNLKQ